YAKLILRAPGAPLVDIEHTASNAFPTQLYLVQGVNGTLKGNGTSLIWKYFKPSETPPLQLDTRPLRNENGEPVYCSEQLKIYEDKWNADTGNLKPGDYDEMEQGLGYYRALHTSFINGNDFPVKNKQIMLQMIIMGEAYTQNSNLFV
ncbi:MAG: hypothetical protein FWF22_09875, partial [Treponema sp.]|nr:hypothetical protein [Treponema sp.]